MGPTSLLFIICKIICFNILRLATILFLLSLRFFISCKSLIMYFVISKSAGWGSFAFKIAFGLFGAYSLINSLQRSNSRRSEVESVATEEGNMILFMYSLIFLSHTWLCQTIRIKLNCRIQKLRELVSHWQWNILDFFLSFFGNRVKFLALNKTKRQR